MYTYIIIDDEPLVREGTKKKLADIKNVATCIGQADNGQDGIALIEACHPNIIILDMLMPVMDGTKLLPYLTEHYPDLPLIVISGYQNFEYMKYAISAKAVDYILKPFSKETVQKAVFEAINRLESHRSIQHQIMMSETQKEQAYYEYDLELLTNLILGYHTASPVLNSQKLNCLDKTHQLVLLTLHFENHKIPASPQAFLDEYYPGELAIYLPHRDAPSIGFVILFLSSSLAISSVEYATPLLGKLLTWYSRQNIRVYVGISERHNSLLELHNAFLETSTAINQQTLDNPTSNFYFSRTNLELQHINWDEQEEFLFRIEAGMVDEVTMLVRSLFKLYRSTPDLTIADVKYHCSQLCGQCRNIMNFYLQQNHTTDSSSMQNIINCIFSLDELQEYYLNFFLNIAGMLQDQTIYASDNIIEKIQFYVKRNYQKNITLEFISSLFYMNRSYLSGLFHQKTGYKFVDYVNVVRVEKAKELIAGSNRKMYQIAKSVGYDNVKYFFRIFKKITGTTPAQYQAQCQ